MFCDPERLSVKGDLFRLPSVEKLIEKVKKVVSFANHSDKFMRNLEDNKGFKWKKENSST